MKQVKHFINGEFVVGSNNKFFEKRSPVDNKVIAQIAEASQSDVDAAVRAAHDALNGEWGKMTVDQRVEMLYAVANEITRRFEDFVDERVLHA